MKPSTQTCLKMLRRGPVTTGEFLLNYQGRFGARLHELQTIHGCEIETAPLDPKKPRGPQIYTLVYEPPDLGLSGDDAGGQNPQPAQASAAESEALFEVPGSYADPW